MISFSVTFSNVLLMLLYLLPGFFMCKAKKVRPDHLSSISVILLYICGFALYVNALSYLDPSPELFRKMGLFLLFSLGGEILLMLLVLLALGKKRRQEFSLRMLSIATVMGNVGFFGMPVVRALFPDAPEAAVYSSMFNAALNIIAWTVGVFTLTGEKKHISLKAALLNPSMLAVFTGAILCLLKARDWMPDILRTGFSTLGAMSTPLCMIILGVRLATMDFRSLFTTRLAWLISAGKLLVFPLFCYLLVLPFPMDPVFKGSILILAGTPCASILLNLAEIHHNGQELAANCALLSTFLSILTIPLLSLLV
jgi:predicted permease